MQNILLGLEIESVVNADICRHLKVGEYHDGIRFFKNSFWEAQDDGSIKAYNAPFENRLNAEFVSDAFKIKSKKSLIKSIEELRDFLTKKNNELELNKILFFDESMGLHIHFSIKNYSFKRYIPIDILKSTRRKFIKLIMNSNINLNAKSRIIKNYDRSYAALLRLNSYHDWRKTSGRYQEFNFLSEEDGRGFEWRSPSLCGIQTWEELKEVCLICFKCCEWLYKKGLRYNLNSTPFKLNLELEESEQIGEVKI